MTKNAIVEVSSNKIREALKSWIDEADNETIERVFNENFDEPISYEVEDECFDVPFAEAEKLGLL